MVSQIFIDRPKLAIVISITTVILGLLCVSTAAIAEYPEIAPPSLMVFANYTGAGSQEVADTVATVIEEQCNGLEDLQYFSSTSSNTGAYQLEITFKSGTDTDIAQVNVQNAIRRAEPLLPTEVLNVGVKIFKRSGDTLAFYSFTTSDASKFSLPQLSNYIRTNIRDPLSRIDGVSEVTILGERNYAMRIWLDPIHMSALKIRPDDVISALRAQNVQAAAGSVGTEFSNNYLQFKVNTLGRLVTAKQFGQVVVKTGSDGRLIRISDIARVELGAESYSNSSGFNGNGAVSLLLYRNSDANALSTVNKVKAELAELSKYFPKEMQMKLTYDPTEYIRISMREIFETLIITLVLVVVITYLFLQDWRATLIPTLTIPVSLIGTFIFMIPLGFSINLLTMFALILVIGSVVDDAIVVTENCVRLIDEENLPPKEAASKCMHQITGAIIATTLVTVAIYAPVAFYGGMVGTIYLQFAITMCIALCLSTVNAMTLSPALAGIILRKRPENYKPNFIFRIFNVGLNWSKNFYLRISARLVRFLLISMILFGAVIYLNKFMSDRIPSSFIPPEDKGVLMASIDMPPGATLQRTMDVQQEVFQMISKIPGVRDVNTITGFSFTAGTGENVGALIATLDDWSKRQTPELQIGAIQAKMKQLVSQIPAAQINIFQPPAIVGLGVTGGVTFALQATEGQSSAQLGEALFMLLGEINSLPDTMFAFSSFDANTPQVYLDIDRNKAMAMGVPVSRIFTTLQSKLASYYVNDFNLRGYSFKVKIQSRTQDRSNLDNIEQMLVQNNNGKMVPISSFAEKRYVVGPRIITRFNQYLCAKVDVQGRQGVSSSVLMKQIENIVNTKLPKGYQVAWTDMSFQERGNDGRFIYLLFFALVFGYLFLVGQYESWTIPLPVITSFAFAMVGGFCGMVMCGIDFSIYAQLGIVMLIGLACKNAILMVEFSKQEREAGKSIFEAAQEGFSQRYRAVLMTAWSFVIGVFPMVIATGAGAESRKAIGITTFYGMLISTIFGIVFIPVLYTFFQWLRETISQRRFAKLYEGDDKTASK